MPEIKEKDGSTNNNDGALAFAPVVLSNSPLEAGLAPNILEM